jgi:hypothetical protein
LAHARRDLAALREGMGKYGSVRQQVLRQFLSQTSLREADEELATALYFMLRSIDDLSVDGWALFRVIQESQDSLDAVGLMTLLPSGSVPIAVNVTTDERENCRGRSFAVITNSNRATASPSAPHPK